MTAIRIRGLTRACIGMVVAAIAMLGLASPAYADRCTSDGSGNWSCTYQARVATYTYNGVAKTRTVRWQTPEGTPPPGGWPIAFYYNGTTPVGYNPFVQPMSANYGGGYAPQIFHELLDDPQGTGKRYAVFAPEPPAQGIGTSAAWDAGSSPYTSTKDYAFFPDFFEEIRIGSYGAASQFNMDRRYGFGISSGGYNTSRMAVTFNQAPGPGQSCAQWCNQYTWRALGIISASYVTCLGPICDPPAQPATHPPTKFWHGSNDLIVPILTAHIYEWRLQDAGVQTAFVTHNGGHALHSSQLGATGVKAWFDLFD